MIGMKELCSLLIAGGMGAGSVVAVQKVKRPPVTAPAAPQKQKAKPAKAVAPKAVKASTGPSLALLTACPERSPGGSTVTPLPQQEVTIPRFADTFIGTRWTPIYGGPGFSYVVSPGIPDLNTWVTMLFGFGFVGLGLRRTRKPVV